MSRNSTLPTLNTTSAEIIELHEKFGTNVARLLVEFSPDKQYQYCRDISRCYFGKAPSISLVSRAYGVESAKSWIEIQLNNLSEFAGCKDKLKPHQITELAFMIMEEYHYFKLTEFMLFFQKFKKCEYGKFYGAVDPMVIMEALDKFRQERHYEYNKEESRKEEERKKKEAQEIEISRARYKSRIPGAFTENAVMTWWQYQSFKYDEMDDIELSKEIDLLATGKKKLPTTYPEMLKIFWMEEDKKT